VRRPRHKWLANTTTNRGELRFEGEDWIELTQDFVEWWLFVSMAV